MVIVDYIWLQWVTFGYIRLHNVTADYIWLQWATYGYS